MRMTWIEPLYLASNQLSLWNYSIWRDQLSVSVIFYLSYIEHHNLYHKSREHTKISEDKTKNNLKDITMIGSCQ